MTLDLKPYVRPLIADTIAISAVTTAAMMLASKIERNSPWAALNPICHMIDGDSREFGDGYNERDTLLGIALNASAMLSWAVIYRFFFKSTRFPRSLLAGAALSAGAYIVDYHIVPKRFSPGIEKKLGGPAIFWVYVALALSFGTRPPIEED